MSRKRETGELLRGIVRKAKESPRRVVFPEGDNEKILQACRTLVSDGIAEPVLLADPLKVRTAAMDLGIPLTGMEVMDPLDVPRRAEYEREFFRLRQRKGVTMEEARELVRNPNYCAALMVRMGDADAMVGGVTQHYPDTLRPALQVIGVRPEIQKASGLFILVTADGQVVFLADATVNVDPTAHDLAEIALCAAQEARRFGAQPRVAMLSFSNFGSKRHALCEKMRRAVQIVRATDPALPVDGEMQADTAVSPEIVAEHYPFCTLRGGANVLICPDLQSANIGYKLLVALGGAEAIGPILMGMKKPVHLLQRGARVEDVVNMAAIAVIDAQQADRPVYVPHEELVAAE